MAATPEQTERVLHFYDAVSRFARLALPPVASDPDAIVAAGRVRFEQMLDELPYRDRPEHSMAGSMFFCAAMLALFEVLREEDVDAHAWGRAIHAAPLVLPDEPDDGGVRAREDAEASQAGAAPNEFVFEMVSPAPGVASGMNVTSCAICHLFGKHDAMDLVPYMCALDDAMSDARGQGLRRTGTIALGATHCDFRFEPGGEPLRLAGQHPDRIRLDGT